MVSNLILTTAQAQAVYSAMCALNKVCGTAPKIEVDAELVVLRSATGVVIVQRQDGAGWPEYYGDLLAFGTAYGLSDPDDNASQPNALRAAAERAMRLFDEALPKFNWGTSFLDANAIRLLNEVPAEVAAALRA